MTEQEDDGDEPIAGVVYACQGPPRCMFTSADGHDPAPHMANCVWCTRIYVMKDGREVEEGPGNA